MESVLPTVVSAVVILFITDTDMMVQKTKKVWTVIQNFFKKFHK